MRFYLTVFLLSIAAKAWCQHGTADFPDTYRDDTCTPPPVFSDSVKTAGVSPLAGDDLRLLGFYLSKGVPFDTTCSQIELYREVYAWLGVRYRYAGLTKKGVDCAGFVRNICNRIYGTDLSGSASHHFKKCIPIERSELEEGDLVFFKIRKNYISHVGIYLGNGKFAHAAVHGGVMINSLSDAYYNKYYYLSGRLINAPNKKRW